MARRFRPRPGKPLPLRPRPRDIARFLSFVRQDGKHWIWTGSVDNKGYALFWYLGRCHRAARWARQVFRGQFQNDTHAHHIDGCRNPMCVHPDCLREETPEWNTADGNRYRAIKRAELEPAPF